MYSLLTYNFSNKHLKNNLKDYDQNPVLDKFYFYFVAIQK